ncbi:MFS transporter [Peterkaempfera bronchialis]|uniref:MFS transporter n=1 Tax=Peterkaempfera bronchialis TaxID=2126346 RepID=A0A345SYQ3_9ACTN|nr:MFS transporter [Peterkaempfera bronchialis]AXI78858.1 MFS transporter [Peterkaempfera bronchialis]
MTQHIDSGSGLDAAAPSAAPTAAPPTAAPQAAQRLTPRARLVLVVLCAAQFMIALDFSVLNVALPKLGHDLGMSPSALQWAVTAFALPSGGFLLLLGRAGDLFGRRRLFLSGLAIFGAASLLATFAWNPAVFLAGRALQGVGAAAIVPTGMSILTTTFPEGPQRDRALGINGTLLSVGFTVGTVLGGVLTDMLGWRSTMGLLALFSLVVLPFAPGLIEESRQARRPRLDLPGAATVTAGLLALIYSLSTAADRGFGGADVIATLVAGVLLLVAFVAVEARTAEPLVSLAMLKRRTVAWGNLGGLVTFAMMSTVVFAMTLYLQEVLDLSPLQTGLVFGVQGTAAALSGGFVPRLIGRFGAHRALVGFLLGQGLFVAALLGIGSSDRSVWLVTPAISLACVCNLGGIIAYGLTVTGGIPHDQQGLATGLVTSSQQVGITIGIPLLGVVATTTQDRLSGVHTVLAIDAAVTLVTGVLVAIGLHGSRNTTGAARD